MWSGSLRMWQNKSQVWPHLSILAWHGMGQENVVGSLWQGLFTACSHGSVVKTSSWQRCFSHSREHGKKCSCLHGSILNTGTWQSPQSSKHIFSHLCSFGHSTLYNTKTTTYQHTSYIPIMKLPSTRFFTLVKLMWFVINVAQHFASVTTN